MYRRGVGSSDEDQIGTTVHLRRRQDRLYRRRSVGFDGTNPLSRDASDSDISLRPMTSWLAAFSTKKNFPLEEALRSH